MILHEQNKSKWCDTVCVDNKRMRYQPVTENILTSGS